MLFQLFIVLGGFPLTQASLCSQCDCPTRNIVNCAGRGLQVLPHITRSDAARIASGALITLVENPDLEFTMDIVKRYFEVFSSFDIDVELCKKLWKLGKDLFKKTMVYRCSTNDLSNPTTNIIAEKMTTTETMADVTARQIHESDSMFQRWLLNMIFTWVGMVITGVTSTLIAKWLIRRSRNEEENPRTQTTLPHHIAPGRARWERDEYADDFLYSREDGAGTRFGFRDPGEVNPHSPSSRGKGKATLPPPRRPPPPSSRHSHHTPTAHPASSSFDIIDNEYEEPQPAPSHAPQPPPKT